AYLVMELVTGKTLKDELKSQPERRLPIKRVEEVMEQLVAALEVIHKAGVYHLDLKPDNVLLNTHGKVVLVDFGAARQGFSSNNSTMAFTEAYAAPEVIAGGDIGPESDIFELGMMLHEMLTGKLPTSALSRLMKDTWEPTDLREPWQSLVMAALQLRSEERPRTVEEWWESRGSVVLPISTDQRGNTDATTLIVSQKSEGQYWNVTNSTATADSTGTISPKIQREQPIPPPSEPKEYRAIGLIKGQYMPSADQLTRGTLVTTDGTLIDAVLLGRVMSLVKNHLDLVQPHLWIVYPRSRQEDNNLHVQIVGVWEPEKLYKKTSTTSHESEIETVEDVSQPEVSLVFQDGYFSIRGEVIYHSKEQERVVIKIRQSPRTQSEVPTFFKLSLKGNLGDKVLGHFWDLHAQLQGNTLLIQEANDIGMMPVRKKRPGKKPFRKKLSYKNKKASSQHSGSSDERPVTAPAKRREPLPKPRWHL
ncbi:MAG: serine/threonine protein kinase, partial [Symploca sp. SIO2G7]|nr:serine/threonine protein kinase [Symploca sp. SIO2G7]